MEATQSDLWGNTSQVSTEADKSEYEAYLASAQWKQRRAVRLEMADNKCERCGVSHFTAQLQVHHRTYERLGNELMSDLEVLCPRCHSKADSERVRATEVAKQERWENSKLRRGFYSWISNCEGPDWLSTMSDYAIVYQAQNFLKYLDLDSHNPKLIEVACGLEHLREDRVGDLLVLADQVGMGSSLANDFARLERIVGMRELADAWDKPMLDHEVQAVLRTASHFRIPYKHYRMDFTGPNAFEWVLVKD